MKPTQQKQYDLHTEAQLQGAPEFCPHTGRQFWGYLTHHELGVVPTYGGPFETFTIPKKDDDGEWRSELYDQDRGEWIEGGRGWEADAIYDDPESVPAESILYPIKAFSGIHHIIEERDRQIAVEGWTEEHDRQYTSSELVEAAVCYADVAGSQIRGACGWEAVPDNWPWEARWWKPSKDPLRNLAKAGALVAAQFDRSKSDDSGVSKQEVVKILSDRDGGNPTGVCALTAEEREVLDALALAWNRFLKLPTYRPDEQVEMKASINSCHGLVALRVATRCNPEIWIMPGHGSELQPNHLR